MNYFNTDIVVFSGCICSFEALWDIAEEDEIRMATVEEICLYKENHKK